MFYISDPDKRWWPGWTPILYYPPQDPAVYDFKEKQQKVRSSVSPMARYRDFHPKNRVKRNTQTHQEQNSPSVPDQKISPDA